MRLGDSVIDPPVLLANWPLLALPARLAAGLVVSEMLAEGEAPMRTPPGLAAR